VMVVCMIKQVLNGYFASEIHVVSALGDKKKMFFLIPIQKMYNIVKVFFPFSKLKLIVIRSTNLIII
jgi:hypothetical protein